MSGDIRAMADATRTAVVTGAGSGIGRAVALARGRADRDAQAAPVREGDFIATHHRVFKKADEIGSHGLR